MTLAARVAEPQSAGGELWHDGWERWVATNLLRGCSDERLIARMIANGIGGVFALKRIEETKRSPIFRAAIQERNRSDKYCKLLEVLGELKKTEHAQVDAHTGLPVQSFYEDYVLRNRPVVLRKAAAAWPAITRWNLAYFVSILGDTEVEVTAERGADPLFEENFPRHVRRWPFSRFANAMAEAPGNEIYLVSKNRLLKLPEATPLLDDFKPHLPYLDKPGDDRDAGLWLGPAGTVTPLHHDACNILFVQVRGRKVVKLIAPAYLPRLYNDRTCFSDFDPERPDYERFPLMEGVPMASVDLFSGDALLIPVGWWHHVRSLELSISLSFTQFHLRRKAHVWRWRPQEHQ